MSEYIVTGMHLVQYRKGYAPVYNKVTELYPIPKKFRLVMVADDPVQALYKAIKLYFKYNTRNYFYLVYDLDVAFYR